MDNELYSMAVETRMLYNAGVITREKAKEMIRPYEDFYNAKVVEIAKKYNRKPKKFNFNSFMR